MNCSHSVIAEQSLCTVRKFYKRHHDLVDPYSVAISRLYPIQWPQAKHTKAFKHRIFIFNDIFHGYIDMASVL